MKHIGNVLLASLLWVAGAVQAAELTHVTGPVQVLGADGKVRNAAARTGDRVEGGESVRTLAGGRVMVRHDGGRYTVLTANSQVKIEDSGVVEQVRGAVYYVLRKLSMSDSTPASYQVKTSVATIGIRGTRFLVATEGKAGEVALSEGLIDMQANEGQSFDIQKLPGDMSYADYRKQQEKLFKGFLKDEFREWKKRQMKEFDNYKKQFMLQPNQSVSLDGNAVRYQEIGADDAALIAELDALVRAEEGDAPPPAATTEKPANSTAAGVSLPASSASNASPISAAAESRSEEDEAASETGADQQAEMDLEAEHAMHRDVRPGKPARK